MANPVVDKFKIDNSVYDVKDTQARADITKKIDIDTTGNLEQTVSGNYNQTVGSLSVASTGNLGLSQNGFIAFYASNNQISIGTTLRNIPVAISGTPQFRSLRPVNIDDNYAYVKMQTGSDNNDTKFLVSRTGKIPSFVEPSPVSIEKYQTLKKDGTDDITATINTHTKNEPLFIPAGTYKISAPLQLKHSLYGAGSSRDPARGTSDTILQYTANPTAFGNQGVITVSGDVTGNIVIANLDITCNGMIGGIVFTTNKYTDNSIYNVSINKVKSYGVYLQPNNSTLNRYCYMDNVMVWGFSDNTPVERWTGSVAFFWGDKAPDCECNNLVNMVCQVGFDCRTDVYGCNWTSYTGIPSGGTGGTDANTWWNNSIACKVTNNDIHVTNFYADTCRYGFVFDGPGKAAAYINNMIYTCDDGTATTETGYAGIVLIGSSPNPQFIVNGGIINRSAKVSTTIQSAGTYPVTNAVCKLDDVYIYTKREYIFGSGAEERGQFICAAGEHRCIDLAITNQVQYTVAGKSVSGDPYQYKAFAYIPVDTNTSQGCIHLTDGTNIDYKIYITKNETDTSLNITAFDNRKLSQSIFNASAGTGKTVTWDVIDNEDKL